MTSDYDQITKNNEDYLGKDTASRSSQVSMYSDFTHFIYEILQNADDYNATEILFKLSSDKLIIEHNGVQFNTENVKAISYFGKSTSREDIVKTGHFGLGFKSVFAFTASPIIHSGDEHFEIYDLYRLRSVTAPSDLPKSHTRIILPFNHENVRPDYIENYVSRETAFDRIAKKLKQLNMNSLLFTQYLRKIKWVTGDEERYYLREDLYNKKYSHIFGIRKTVISDEYSPPHRYLVFSRSIQWCDSSSGNINQYKPVDIAFKLSDDEKNVTETKHPLVVLFETKIETHMGFLINGPYRTTPNRETVNNEDEFNKFLITETAILISETFPQLKRMGLMDINLLMILPIFREKFIDENENNLFKPIYECIKVELYEKRLLPTDDRTFISAKQSKLASAQGLRRLLSNEQLMCLFEVTEPLKWLTGEITSTSIQTRNLWGFLRTELHVEEITPDVFARRITKHFIEKQTDNWMTQFYEFLIGQEALWRAPRGSKDTGGFLRNRPIIRLIDGNHVNPFKEDGSVNAYLPPPEDTDFPVVKREIASERQAKDFLNRLGLAEPDIFDDIVEKVIPKYCHENSKLISLHENKMDIKKIMRALGSDSEKGKKKVSQITQDTPFIRSINSKEGYTLFKKPTEIYANTEKLRTYFNINSNVWFIDEDIVDESISDEELDALGVAFLPRLKLFSDGLPPEEREYATKYEIIENFKLDGLEEFLNNLSHISDFTEKKNMSLILWNFLSDHLKKNSNFFKGNYSWFYFTQHSKYFDVNFLSLLRETEWLPSENGFFHKPSDITLNQLPEYFKPDNNLISALGKHPDSREATKHDIEMRIHYAKKLNVDLRDIEFLNQHPEEFQKWKENINTPNKNKPEFPAKSSDNPERRKEKTIEKLDNDPFIEYESKQRIVRTSKDSIDSSTWLYNLYTNDDGRMVCQICQDEMPFKKRNGKYYFETVEIFGKKFNIL